ncbi:kinase-like domain-containing protein [Rhizophagus clarus]|uniref:Kinase-like domain-containing protein n=1 Tax=Rhizophagus clarus TaxID=94130 RepID=A0A8H3KVV6_9GLOM|nr:kinase-like domain-containing protein [Rhizophagus clarus]
MLDPLKRPDAHELWDKICEINCFDQNKSNIQLEENNNLIVNSLESYINCTSKVYQFKNLTEPRNVTEEELQVNDFDKSVKQEDNVTLINKGNCKLICF